MNINNAACSSISRRVQDTHTHTHTHTERVKDKHINRQTEWGRCERQLRGETHTERERERRTGSERRK